MKKTISISLLMSCFCFLAIVPNSSLNAQAVCGAAIEKRHFRATTHRLSVSIQVVREGWHKDHLIFDWGDGDIDTIPRLNIIVNEGEYLVDIYNSDHVYDSSLTSYVELKVLDEEIISDLTNVDYSESTTLTLSDSMLVYTVESTPYLFDTDNDGPPMNHSGAIQYEGGIFTEDFVMYLNPIEPDTLAYSLAPFPVAGYSPPAPPEELYMEGGILFWNRPLQEGKYAAAVKIRELRFTNNPIYDSDWTMVSTITRAFTILVDSTGLATSLPSLEPTKVVSVYPNPASSQVTIATSGLERQGKLRIRSIDGRLMYQSAWLAGDVQEQTIGVSLWPAGTYVLELEAEDRVISKIIVIE